MDEAKIRKLAKFFPPKFERRIIEALEKDGVPAALKILKLAQKAEKAESSTGNQAPSHPIVSTANLTPLQRDVLDGLKQGFSVNKIAQLYGHKSNSVWTAKRALHRKKVIVASSSPPELTTSTIKSQPNVHSFIVDIIVPFPHDAKWRERSDVSKVQNFKVTHLKFNVQHCFDLLDQVSVRVTSRKFILCVKGVWDVSVEGARRQAWDLAVKAAVLLQGVYNFVWDVRGIPMRFRGAHWCLVGHEVARECVGAGVKPVTFVNGEKRMWVDSSPGVGLEFSREEDARKSFADEEARLVRGLTNENLSKHLVDIAGKLGVLVDAVNLVVKVQEHQGVLLNSLLVRPEHSVEPVVGRLWYVG